MWLHDFLPGDLQEIAAVRVMTYGYSTPLDSPTVRNDGLNDLAKDLLEHIENSRSETVWRFSKC